MSSLGMFVSLMQQNLLPPINLKLLQRLTNNYLKSTTHRVVNPPRHQWHVPRLSIPFFLHPKGEMDLTCLDSCVTDQRPLAYENTTAGDYLDERLREIGLKK